MSKKSCWPCIHIKWNGVHWLAVAKNCNTTATGKSPQEAYDNWQWFYRLDI